jgi:hypothetical protein
MKNPQELIDHIANIVQQKVDKKMKCFYSLKIHKNDATTELIERKSAGGEEFLKDVQEIINVNKPDTLIVELYRGSSYKVKSPESEFFINLSGREISFPVKVEPLGGYDNSLVYSEMRKNFDQQMQSVREFSGLHSSFSISQLELKHSEAKVKELKEDLKVAEEYIEKLEKEIKSRPQLAGVGGMNIVELGSYWLEGILRRNPKLVAGTLGINEQQVSGLFTNSKPAELPQPKEQGTATASIKEETEQLTPNQQKRVEVIESIAGFLRGLSDKHLRIVYELMCATAKDISALEKMMNAVGIELTEKNEEEKQ